MAKERIARRYLVWGRVQGVGYRNFAQMAAQRLGIRGFTRNLDDGRVEVYAIGLAEQLDDFEGKLRQGPHFGEVRGMEQSEAPMLDYGSFHIQHD